MLCLWFVVVLRVVVRCVFGVRCFVLCVVWFVVLCGASVVVLFFSVRCVACCLWLLCLLCLLCIFVVLFGLVCFVLCYCGLWCLVSCGCVVLVFVMMCVGFGLFCCGMV